MKYVVYLFLSQIGVGSYAIGLFLLLGIAAYLYISKRKLQTQYEELMKGAESYSEKKGKPKTRTVEPDERAQLPVKMTKSLTVSSANNTHSKQPELPRNQIHVIHKNGLDHFQPIIDHLIHKKDFLKRMKQELRSVSSENKDPETMTYVNRLNRLVDNEQKMEKEWAIFNRYFQQIHPNFQERLVQQFPKLSAKDIRICCLLRMDMSTKEMAPLLNITDRGTEISRYRLRKKLSLSPKSNLVDHIRNI